jgi:hypothetical protein
MTSGPVNIQIGNSRIDGVFVNGKIVSGTWQPNERETYSGNFDENENLHGVGCRIFNLQKFEGVFEHGIFQLGKEYYDGVLRAEGKFAQRLSSLPCLVEGTKYCTDATYIGVFNSDWRGMKHGTVTYTNGTVMKGIWNHNAMQEGTVVNEKLGFKAYYTTRRDMNLNKDLLQTCQVEFSGDPTTLPKELLLLYACRGNNCTNIHSIYSGELERMQGNGVGYLLKFANEIRKDFKGFELPVYDEMIVNLTTPARMDDLPEIQSSNLEMFGSYYRSHD